MVCLALKHWARESGWNRGAGAAILGRMEPTPPGRELLLADEPASASSLEARMGRRIAAQRALMGLSVEDLAGRSGLPLARLQDYESGLERVEPADLFRLCDALQVGPACFLDDLPDPGRGGERDG